MFKRLLLIAGVVGCVTLQTLFAHAASSSTSGTNHNVTQTLTILYNRGTCGGTNWAQITQEEIFWTRTDTTYKASASANRTEEVGTKCDSTSVQLVDDWNDTVCWKPCSGSAFLSSTDIVTYSWPRVIFSGQLASIGGSGHGIIVVQATGQQVGDICTPVTIFGTVVCR